MPAMEAIRGMSLLDVKPASTRFSWMHKVGAACLTSMGLKARGISKAPDWLDGLTFETWESTDSRKAPIRSSPEATAAVRALSAQWKGQYGVEKISSYIGFT